MIEFDPRARFHRVGGKMVARTTRAMLAAGACQRIVALAVCVRSDEPAISPPSPDGVTLLSVPNPKG